MDPAACDFNAKGLIGDEIGCGGQKTTTTASSACAVNDIRIGPRSPPGTQIWHGLTPGTNHATLANITITPEGVRSPYPDDLPVLDTLLLFAKLDLSSVTLTDSFALWAQAALG